MQAYSFDLRERVVAAYEKGKTTISAVAAQFSVGETFVKKMLRQKRERGSLRRLPSRAGAKKALEPKHRHWLAGQIREQPDATLTELQTGLLARQAVSVSRATVSRELRQMRLPRKKSRLLPLSAITGNAGGSGGK